MYSSDPSHVQHQLAGMSLGGPGPGGVGGAGPLPVGQYPSVPQPAPMPGMYPMTQGYPSDAANSYPAGAAGQGYLPAGSTNGYHASNGVTPTHSEPVSIGSGWTADAVKPEAARPGQSAGHYGHLQ